MKKEYIYRVIGLAAFVVGGLVAQAKTTDVIETLEQRFGKDDEPQDDE